MGKTDAVVPRQEMVVVLEKFRLRKTDAPRIHAGRGKGGGTLVPSRLGCSEGRASNHSGGWGHEVHFVVWIDGQERKIQTVTQYQL